GTRSKCLRLIDPEPTSIISALQRRRDDVLDVVDHAPAVPGPGPGRPPEGARPAQEAEPGPAGAAEPPRAERAGERPDDPAAAPDGEAAREQRASHRRARPFQESRRHHAEARPQRPREADPGPARLRQREGKL